MFRHMRIFLIRHGESLGNVDPTVYGTVADHAIPLSSHGRAQTAEAAGHLRRALEEHVGNSSIPVRMWTSPYARTRETARILLDGLGDWVDESREHVLLCEQQFGLFDGVPDHELSERFPEEWAHYRKCVEFEGKFWARIPLGESRFDVAARVHQSFSTFTRDARLGVKNIVVVGPGVMLRAFVMMWCHLTPEWFEGEPNPRNCAIRLIDGSDDKGYLFTGFPRASRSSP
jgi:2,3-bisphosphoglycerate-dependent phosphoglycerate mutase